MSEYFESKSFIVSLKIVSLWLYISVHGGFSFSDKRRDKSFPSLSRGLKSILQFNSKQLLFLHCYQILNMLLIHFQAVVVLGMFLCLSVCPVDYFLQTTINRLKNYLCFSCWITNQPAWLTQSLLPSGYKGAILTTKVENYPGNSNKIRTSVSKDAVIISETDRTNCSSTINCSSGRSVKIWATTNFDCQRQIRTFISWRVLLPIMIKITTSIPN